MEIIDNSRQLHGWCFCGLYGLGLGLWQIWTSVNHAGGRCYSSCQQYFSSFCTQLHYFHHAPIPHCLLCVRCLWVRVCFGDGNLWTPLSYLFWYSNAVSFRLGSGFVASYRLFYSSLEKPPTCHFSTLCSAWNLLLVSKLIQLLVSYQAVIQPSINFQSVVRQSSGSCQALASQVSGSPTVVARQSQTTKSQWRLKSNKS